MAPKSRPACESGERIVTLRCRLNSLHRHRAGLNLSIFFEEGGVHSLGPTWTARVPVAVENNMPAANWFTFNPYAADAGIFASKWSNFKRGFPLMKDEAWSKWVDELEPIWNEAWSKWVDELELIWKQIWMANGIYELIMMSKTTISIKHELLTTVILFLNTGTNTFDFRVGLMTPTILDMAQVFGLRSSSKCVDIKHDWSSPSCPTIESSEASQSITSLEYNSTTFKSYETSFAGFISFAKKMFSPPSLAADPAQEHIIFSFIG